MMGLKEITANFYYAACNCFPPSRWSYVKNDFNISLHVEFTFGFVFVSLTWLCPIKMIYDYRDLHFPFLIKKLYIASHFIICYQSIISLSMTVFSLNAIYESKFRESTRSCAFCFCLLSENKKSLWATKMNDWVTKLILTSKYNDSARKWKQGK